MMPSRGSHSYADRFPLIVCCASKTGWRLIQIILVNLRDVQRQYHPSGFEEFHQYGGENFQVYVVPLALQRAKLRVGHGFAEDLRDVIHEWEARAAVHHERWDGNGRRLLNRRCMAFA